jgi:hypothetical protein
MNEELTLQISNAFNDTGAYKELTRLLFVSNILGRDEIEELVDRLEAFITQEVQEIIDER